MSSASVSYLFDRAMTIFKRDTGVLIVATLIYLALFWAVGGATAGIASLLLYGPLTAGYSLFILKLVRGQRAELSDLFLPLQQDPIQVIVAGALLMVFYIIGLALCVIPGIVVTFLYMFTFFYLVDMRMPAWDAMESSRRRISSDWAGWMGLFIIVAAVNLVGAMLCGVGLLLTIPFTTIMLGIAYDERSGTVQQEKSYDEI